MNHKKLHIALMLGLATLSMGAVAQNSGKKIYIVQMADAPAATYDGKLAGLAATKAPAGARFNAAGANVKSYRSYLTSQHSAVLSRVGAPAALHNYTVVFNGFSAALTPAQAKALQTSTKVVSVTESRLIPADTTRTPDFLGLTAPGGLWSQLDTAARKVKGEDVIIGVLDTGIWPETASFGDKVDAQGNPVPYYQAGTSVYGPPPAKWKGTCVAGEGFTAAMCNNKLIGARYYGDAWYAGAANSGGAYAAHPRLEYKSPRDGGGHGSHTASTAGGNANVNATINGTAIGSISGMAPRARIAVYKVLWTSTTTPNNDGGQTADILAAINDAVADGVDVINYSISGTQTNFNDPIEIAYLNATAAGVFVAASAGNSGPANQVAHMSPWLMTVGASTHDRQALADLVLGDASVYSNGVSVYGSTLTGSMILADSAVASGQAVADAQRCFAGTLDPTKVSGKIVVCDRGVNARVDKSAEVKRAGGIGMVLVNASATADGLVADFHSVPSIHLPVANRAGIRNYVTAGAATGTIKPPAAPPAIVAPVMADFSSRGPNKANGNILKPDITGPGVDILAAYIDDSQTQAQHDATIAGTYLPLGGATSMQGTSMSSPHVAGIAALLKQQHPDWSPAAIKSAMMTSAGPVKLANGVPDLDRWGYGAGHVNPNGATATPLVYDLTAADHGRFLCGIGLTPPAGIGSCASLGSIAATDLNLPSLTAKGVVISKTFNRTIKNVSTATKTFTASATLPSWDVVVSPSTLTLAPGASASFTVKVTPSAAVSASAWSFGNLSWSDGVTVVSSPLSANGSAGGFSLPASVSDVRKTGNGSKVFSVTSGYSGKLGLTPVGLVPATRNANNIATGQKQCYDVVVPAGALLARFQLFDADTSGPVDLDLDIYAGPGGTGANVGSSGGATADELVSLKAPAAGTYSACVSGYDTANGPGGKVDYALSTWTLGPVVGAQTLRAAGPTAVYAGGTASVGLGWSVPVGHRYLGQVQFNDTTNAVPVSLGTTLVLIDNR